MLGAIIGDIVGSRFEFNNHRSIDFEFFHPACTFTDDTICTVAVADWLLNPAYDLSETMRRWCRKYPNPAGGYGLSFKKWIFSNSGPYDSFGNGSAMRCSPVGWWANDISSLNRLARRSAQITHDHSEGIKGAQCIAVSIWKLRNGEEKNSLKKYIELKFDHKLDQTCDIIRKTNQFDETCQVTVPQAIQCFLESTDFESAIRLAVSIGGDSDTIAAITGSLAEAHYGIPFEMTKYIFRILPDDMLEVIRKFTEKTQMTGEHLFEYYQNQNSDYASIDRMLPDAVGSFEKAFQILEQCQQEKKKLFAYYPGTDTYSTEARTKIETLEPIGDILDGALYVIPAEW